MSVNYLLFGPSRPKRDPQHKVAWVTDLLSHTLSPPLWHTNVRTGRRYSIDRAALRRLSHIFEWVVDYAAIVDSLRRLLGRYHYAMLRPMATSVVFCLTPCDRLLDTECGEQRSPDSTLFTLDENGKRLFRVIVRPQNAHPDTTNSMHSPDTPRTLLNANSRHRCVPDRVDFGCTAQQTHKVQWSHVRVT